MPEENIDDNFQSALNPMEDTSLPIEEEEEEEVSSGDYNTNYIPYDRTSRPVSPPPRPSNPRDVPFQEEPVEYSNRVENTRPLNNYYQNPEERSAIEKEDDAAFWEHIADIPRGVIYGGLGAVEAGVDLSSDILNETIALAERAGLNEPGGFRVGSPEMNAQFQPKTVTGSVISGFAQVVTSAFMLAGLGALVTASLPATATGAVGVAGTAALAGRAGSLLGRTKKAIQYLTQFGKGRPLPKSLKGKLGVWSTQGALLDFVAFQENEARLSNWIESFPDAQNPITGFLAAKTEQEEHWFLGRLKNVVEGMGAGLVLGPLFHKFLPLFKKMQTSVMKGDAKGLKEAHKKAYKELPKIVEDIKKDAELIALHTEDDVRALLTTLEGMDPARVNAALVLFRTAAELGDYTDVNALLKAGFRGATLNNPTAIPRNAGKDLNPQRFSSSLDIAKQMDGPLGDGTPYAMFDEKSFSNSRLGSIREHLDKLKERGQIIDYQTHKIHDTKGGVTNNYVVPGMSEVDATRIAKEFETDKVVTARGIHLLKEGKIIPFTNIRTSTSGYGPPRVDAAGERLTHLTIEELADKAGVSPRTLQNWAKKGYINRKQVVKEGKTSWEYDEESIATHLEKGSGGRKPRKFNKSFTDENGLEVKYDLVYGKKPIIAESRLHQGPNTTLTQNVIRSSRVNPDLKAPEFAAVNFGNPRGVLEGVGGQLNGEYLQRLADFTSSVRDSLIAMDTLNSSILKAQVLTSIDSSTAKPISVSELDKFQPTKLKDSDLSTEREKLFGLIGGDTDLRQLDSTASFFDWLRSEDGKRILRGGIYKDGSGKDFVTPETLLETWFLSPNGKLALESINSYAGPNVSLEDWVGSTRSLFHELNDIRILTGSEYLFRPDMQKVRDLKNRLDLHVFTSLEADSFWDPKALAEITKDITEKEYFTGDYPTTFFSNLLGLGQGSAGKSRDFQKRFLQDPIKVANKIPHTVYHRPDMETGLVGETAGTFGNAFYFYPNRTGDEWGEIARHVPLKNPLSTRSTSTDVTGAPTDPQLDALRQLGKSETQAIKIIEDAIDKKGGVTDEIAKLARKKGYDGIVWVVDGEVKLIAALDEKSINPEGVITFNENMLYRTGSEVADFMPRPDPSDPGIRSIDDILYPDRPASSFDLSTDRGFVKSQPEGLGEAFTIEMKPTTSSQVVDRGQDAIKDVRPGSLKGPVKTTVFRAGSAEGEMLNFGSEKAAKKAATGDREITSGEIELDNPATLIDSGRSHDQRPVAVAEDLVAGDNPGIRPELVDVIRQIQKTSGDEAAFKAIKEALENHGYDGMAYLNKNEDPGSISYVALDSNQFTPGAQREVEFRVDQPDPNNVTRIFYQPDYFVGGEGDPIGLAQMKKRFPKAEVVEVATSDDETMWLTPKLKKLSERSLGKVPKALEALKQDLLKLKERVESFHSYRELEPYQDSLLSRINTMIHDLSYSESPNLSHLISFDKLVHTLDKLDNQALSNSMHPLTLPQLSPKGAIKGGVTFPLGPTSYERDGSVILHLFNKSFKDKWGREFEPTDISTIVHEFGHVFMHMLKTSDKPGSVEKLARIEKALGVKDGIWTVAQEEKFARNLETWLTNQGSQIPGLNRTFKGIKTWMDELYRDVNNSPLRDEVPQEIQSVFGRIFNNDGQARFFSEQERNDFSAQLQARITNGEPPLNAIEEVGLNFRHLKLDTDMEVVMKSLVELVDKPLRDLGVAIPAKSAPLKNTLTADLADIMGVKVDRFEAELAKTAIAADNMPTHLVAGKMLILTYTRSVVDLASRVKFSESAAAELPLMVDRLSEVFSNVMRIQRGGARTTQAGNIKISGFDKGLIEDIIAQKGGLKKVNQLADDILLAEEHSVAKMLRTRNKSKLAWDMIVELRINGLLSSMKSYTIDVISTGLHLAMLPAERAIGGMAMGLTKGDWGLMKEGFGLYQGYSRMLKDSIILGAKAFYRESPYLDPMLQSVERINKAWSKERIGQVFPGFQTTAIGQAIDFLGRTVIRWPSRLRLFSDEVFGQIAYRGNLWEKISREAVRKFDPKTQKDEIAKYIVEQFEASFDDLGRGIDKEAMAYSRKAKFTTPVTTGLGGVIQRAKLKSPLVEMLVPFVRTPTNLFRGFLQRSAGSLTLIPGIGELVAKLNPGLKEFRADYFAGGSRRADAIGKMASGTMMMGAAAVLATEGFHIPGVGHVKLIGNGPPDPDQRRIAEAGYKDPKTGKIIGKKFNSFEITNAEGDRKYFVIDRGDPWAMIFLPWADMFQMGDYLSPDQREDLAGIFIMTAANRFDGLYFKGAIDAMAAWSSGGGKMTSFGISFTKSLVPLQGALTQNPLADLFPELAESEFGKDFIHDPFRRDARDVMTAWTSIVPYLWKSFGYKRDPIFGYPLMKSAAWGPDQMSPFALGESPKGDNPLAKVSDLLYGFEPASAVRHGVDLRTIPITGREGVANAYHRFQELISEQPIEKELRSMVYHADWDRTSRPLKINLIKRLLDHHRNYAFARLLDKEPDVVAALNQEAHDSLQKRLPPVQAPVGLPV